MSAISEARGRTPRRSPRKRTVDTARAEDLLTQAGDIVLAEGFTTITMDQLAQRLGCSKATLYSAAGTKEQLVQTITRRFFVTSAEQIEQAVAEETDPRQRIRTYLTGVGTAMRRHSPAFYDDMVSYEPTARIYRKNSDTAARRVRELIDDGIQAGAFRDINGTFAAQVVAVAIDAVQSGELLHTTGLTAGDAFSALGDLILDGLSRPATT
ncbi:TetR/AcrR family transcriptional regulator [Amycolatopsis magusensis]|uniref:AcrR family transcriptional regulator n=1 Tax=Amycolatopsis magusensis TaxID=882444 RepID=A0ABS4Q0I5_9PSEU|nr:TetR/AcrR family transcriptional regulator [Amycolatopsis magusensis]MBP2184361.1 AcrR family transcriptional regulator [Amycolatopsis magusensis]